MEKNPISRYPDWEKPRDLSIATSSMNTVIFVMREAASVPQIKAVRFISCAKPTNYTAAYKAKQ